METTVLKLAAELCGADEGELLLGALCDAAETSWERRLMKSPGDGECCVEALRCAAAFTAAADYLCRGAGTESFTVGDVTVKRLTGQAALTMADALRQSAERLMSPYAEPEDFCFRGVSG